MKSVNKLAQVLRNSEFSTFLICSTANWISFSAHFFARDYLWAAAVAFNFGFFNREIYELYPKVVVPYSRLFLLLLLL